MSKLKGGTTIAGHLAWHRGNMGAGSGMNADLLDGYHASDFLLRSGGVMDGVLTLPSNGGTNQFKPGTGDGASYTTHNFILKGWYGMGMQAHDDTINGYYDFRAGKWDVKGGFYINGTSVWHPGNDGAGSGLDADTLDGIDSTGFMKTVNANGYYGMARGSDGNTTDWIRTTVNGLLPYNSGGASSLGTSSWQFTSAYAVNFYENNTLLSSKYLGISAKAADSDKLDGIDSANFVFGQNGTGTTAITDANSMIKSGFYESSNLANGPKANTWFWIMNASHTSNTSTYKFNGQIAFENIASGQPAVYVRTTAGNITSTAWAKLYHSGNLDELSQSNEEYDVFSSSKDANGIFTVVDYKRQDGTLFMKSTLSSPNANGNYTVDTWQFYDAAGTTVVKTSIWDIAYDTDGGITSKNKR